MSPEIALPSYAKVNLTLRVFPQRPDGFHDLESLVLQLDLHDDVRVRLRPDGLRSTTCRAANVPPNGENLAHRAATAFLSAVGKADHGFEIEIEKRISVGGGLGGGSSNAAAALVGLNRLLGEPLATAELGRIGAAVGSDVPLFFTRGLAAVTGRGEIVHQVPAQIHTAFVLITPDFACPTGPVYAAFDELPPPPPRADLQEVLREVTSRGVSNALLFNDLLPAARRVEARLSDLIDRLLAAGLTPHLSGSGSTLFLVADDRVAAESLERRVTALGERALVATATQET